MAGRGCYSVEKYQLPWCSNTELKIYHLSFFRHTLIATSTLLILAVCRTRVKYEPTIWPRSPTEFSVAQVDRAPARCWEIIGSNPVGDTGFFFVPGSSHADYFMFTFVSRGLRFTIFHSFTTNKVP